MGVKALLLGLGAAAALAGCSTSGNNFDPGALSMLTPGESTLQEAAYALGAAPVVLYGQSDGGALALWSFKATFVTDGLYSRKEALLQFGPDGRLVRLVDTTNLLLEPWERRKLLGPAPGRLDGPAGAPWSIPVPAAPMQ